MATYHEMLPAVRSLSNVITQNYEQRRHVTPEGLTRWFDGVLADQRFAALTPQQAFNELKWLVRRQSGLSGTDVAPIILRKRGRIHPFSTARDIVTEKLFIRAPRQNDAWAIDRARGHRIEPIARARFRELAPSLGLAPRDDLIDALRGYRHKTVRSMIGTPDEICIDLADNALVIADYKAPRPDGKPLAPRKAGEWLLDPDDELVSEAEGKWFDYLVQMTQYGLLLRDSLGQPDAPVKLKLIRWCGVAGDVVIDELPWDPALVLDVLDAHTDMWTNHVLTGTIPPILEMPQVLDGRAVPDKLLEIGDRRALYHTLLNAIKGTTKALTTEIETWLGATGHLAGKLELGHQDVKGTIVYDEDVLVAYGASLGVDDAPFRAASNALDASAIMDEITDIRSLIAAGDAAEGIEGGAAMPEHPGLVAAAMQRMRALVLSPPVKPGRLDVAAFVAAVAAAGGDCTQFARQELTVSLPRGKKERAAAVSAIGDMAKDAVDGIVHSFLHGNPEDVVRLVQQISEEVNAAAADVGHAAPAQQLADPDDVVPLAG